MAVSVFTVGCSMFGVRNLEMPDYEVVTVDKDADIEVRRYSTYIVAKTYVDEPDFREAQGKAFRKLANYIFGDNAGDQEIAMTAPVVQQPRDGTKIAMTAPVVQKPEEEQGGWVMTFMMPPQYTLEDLPAPRDDSVEFEEVPEKLVAAIQYSWFGSASRNETHAAELEAWLGQQERYKAISAPMYAGYDPPWTIPFLRRNEMLVELEDTQAN